MAREVLFEVSFRDLYIMTYHPSPPLPSAMAMGLQTQDWRQQYKLS